MSYIDNPAPSNATHVLVSLQQQCANVESLTFQKSCTSLSRRPDHVMLYVTPCPYFYLHAKLLRWTE